jgi:hypothetical protein
MTSAIIALPIVPPNKPNKRPGHQGSKNPSLCICNTKVLASEKKECVDEVGRSSASYRYYNSEWGGGWY